MPTDAVTPPLTEQEEAALHDMLVRYARGVDVQPTEQADAVRLIRAEERKRTLAEAIAKVREVWNNEVSLYDVISAIEALGAPR